MYHPESYSAALALMIVTMFGWGSWANTQKMVARFPFQLFYWDYVIGVLLVTLSLGLTVGSMDGGSDIFVTNLAAATSVSWVYGLLAGIIFNVANLLLVTAIAIAGLAVAFPVAIGLALVIGVVLNYTIQPNGNPLLLGLGVAFVIGAIVVDAMAYGARNDDRKRSRGGLMVSIASGVLMGLFYPLVVKAQAPSGGLGPYSAAFVFAIGVALCAIPTNIFLMSRPLTADPPATFGEYRSAPLMWHIWGIVGGVIWGLAMVCSLVAASAALVGPAISYAIGQGATMISAAWGVFVWREFADAPRQAKRLIPAMFVLFIIGLGLVALAPVIKV